MERLFGTSGIRGIYPSEVSPLLAMRTGNAVASKSPKICLSRDTRKTSEILSCAFSAGAMLAGAEIVDFGVAPTPLLAYATSKEKCAGAMITASHNPPQYNGIKLFSCGMEIPKSEESEIEEKIKGAEKLGGGGWAAADWRLCGQLACKDISSEYANFLLSQIDRPSITGRRPRVLVDAGNASAYRLAPQILKSAGCEVVELNCSQPGEFLRDLEPKAESLAEAASAVVQNGCDFGVAFDGDGDRAIAIDERGRTLSLDVQLAIFCKHFLARRKGVVVSTVEASLCVKEEVEKAGGRLVITPVGSLNVAEEVRRTDAVFGGEPCGEYIFPSSIPCADGLLSALFLAEIFCAWGKLSSLAQQVRQYPIARKKFACKNSQKGKAMEKIKKELAACLSMAKASFVDGLRLDFDDGWLLVRPSGTEPAIRLTCEFKAEGRLKEISKKAEEAIASACEA